MCLEQLPFGAVLWTAGVCIDYKGVIFMTQAPEVRWSRAMQFGVGCSVALQHLPVRTKLGTGLLGRHPVLRSGKSSPGGLKRASNGKAPFPE